MHIGVVNDMNRMDRSNPPLVLQAVLFAMALVVHPPDAAAVSGGVGIDYMGGPGDQTTKDALGYVSATLGGGDLTLIGARYDNTAIGAGSAGSIGVGIPLLGSTLLRGSAARTIGDQTYRAWRLQAGPQFGVGGGRTLGVFYLHLEDNLASLSNGVLTELGIPLSPVLVGGVGASLASIERGRTSAQGSASLTWGPVPRLQLLGEMSVGRNVIGYSQTGSSPQGGVLGQLPILGQGPSGGQPGAATVEYGARATALVGLRYLFP